MPPESFIIDADKVLARFGRWPSFHDMEVVSVHMERRGDEGAPWIEFVVHVWDYTGRVTPHGFYEQGTQALVRLRCERVTASELGDFNEQNVLVDLEFTPTPDGVDVYLPTIHGLGAALSCGRVRVVEVVPATPDGLPAHEG